MDLKNNKSSNKFQNCISSARISGLTRNREWLKKMIDKGKIYYNFDDRYEILHKRNYAIFTEQLFELITVFERKFVDKWDIHLTNRRIDNKNYYEISFIMYYPKLEITNSSDQSRELTDLIAVLPVTFSVDNNCIYTKRIQGTRVTLLQDEWNRGYMHSHLPGISKITGFNECLITNNFCIGSEDLSELDIELSAEFDSDKFELMLYTIDSLVAWESLEGGPYFRMGEITIEDAAIRVTTSTSEIMSIYRKFLSYVSYELALPQKLPLNFVYIDGVFKIKKDFVFTQFLKDAFLNNENLKEYVTKVICKKGSDGKFYTYPEMGQRISGPQLITNKIKEQGSGEMPFLYIQGKKLSFNILPIEQITTIDISEYGIYPNFLDYVCKQLESEIYKACVRGSGINYIETSSNYVRRDSEQNQVPL
ncbi:hypothetical protein BOX09_gp57 [Flavobacterium phage Fpv1]|uniref:Uncharacterized protein n=2 Tax=Fipvunavirus Fpv1 TaxID=2560475 RepID=A0A1B0WKI5_9CAUD|nr:hypothetical protein BOW81_gp57 [Flavobacterium phage Fpv20]YP_009322059.1 hypothetical protein BOX09_gp57 [Flavobacterium phage Fpv1]YP_009323648.1 hypothetical protein BOW82_gp57 [Flavobacterium phage Fpv2]ALN97301.1 hypothetical protein [Flavobacterium phage FpV21]QCW20285.1 hypothetical protein [Flavobacterium phage FPSV-F12]QCW20718.1 hypothetical protein [Flavobacterium phage FPSV-S29]ANB40299.1 hypothetical protein [Flavobacterium phage Fpv1]ANB40379.1 hypothetical protein [Flavoba